MSLDEIDAVVWERERGSDVFTSVAGRLTRTLGYDPQRWLGEAGFWPRIVHPDDRTRVEQALSGAGVAELTYRIVSPDGHEAWVRDVVTISDDGRLSGVMTDATSMRASDERSARRLARADLLAQATTLLAGTLDAEAALDRFASLVVRELADVCTIDLRERDGTWTRAVTAYADPGVAATAAKLTDVYGADPLAGAGRDEIAEGAEAAVHADVAAEYSAADDPGLALLVRLGVRASVCVAIRSRTETLGALTIAAAGEGTPWGEEEVEVASSLAWRIGLVMDNLRLYEERVRIGRTLQEGLLPAAPPTIPGMDIAAVYRPASVGAEVGGDLYDVFQTGRRSWALVVGDVCGKGAEAAAVTALARHTLRAAAMQRRSPGRILGVLNEAIRRHDTDRYCSVAYVRLVLGPPTRVTIASGGHPLPLLCHADGVEAVGRGGTILGVFEDPHLEELTIHLPRGDVLVLYTDGVTDARRGNDRFGTDRLGAVVRANAGRHAAAIASEIERSASDFAEGAARDDMAVLVLRVPPRR